MENNEIGQVKKSRKKYEAVIILVVIVAALIIAFGISRTQGKAEKSRVLIAELTQIRSAISTYIALNKTNPPDLETLAKMTYTFAPNEPPQQYLSNIAANKDGKIVDPFGNLYDYDAKKGWVTSSTKGFEHW